MLGVAGKRERGKRYRRARRREEKGGGRRQEDRANRGEDTEKKVRRRLGKKKDYVESERFDPEKFLELRKIYPEWS